MLIFDSKVGIVRWYSCLVTSSREENSASNAWDFHSYNIVSRKTGSYVKFSASAADSNKSTKYPWIFTSPVFLSIAPKTTSGGPFWVVKIGYQYGNFIAATEINSHRNSSYTEHVALQAVHKIVAPGFWILLCKSCTLL